ncbi:hypothetical protein EAX61_02945 [Dokdonia sinensis]|uniref:Lipocalin-like domain-containing protein n=1 Tax=Dokdonia sinensis TaxID=2479847 RepID=A0A3M0GEM7_9FLAO|nr:hypothetical protein [Dokdonia sinensis]RMB63365.1 hypothetical protein EAX61_02945 [Dokdonia sinensis]
MRLHLILIICALSVAISCKDTKQAPKKEAIPPVESMPTPAEPKEIPKTSTFGKLQGKWQSTEDPKSFLIFEGTKRIALYQGREPDSQPFKLAANCDDEKATYSKVKTLYILSDGICWSIDAINSEHLELTYVDRGNILTYKKVTQ